MKLDPFLALLIGWVFGVATHMIIEWNRRLRRSTDLRKGILAELDEVRYGLAWAVLYIAGHLEQLDRVTFQWIQPIIEKYRGSNADPAILPLIERARALPDDQLAATFKDWAQPGQGMFQKRVRLPLLSAALHDLPLLPGSFQRLALEALRQVEAINEEIEFANANFARTFDSSITGSNRMALESNISQGYSNIGRMSRQFVERVAALEQWSAGH